MIGAHGFTGCDFDYGPGTRAKNHDIPRHSHARRRLVFCRRKEVTVSAATNCRKNHFPGNALHAGSNPMVQAFLLSARAWAESPFALYASPRLK